MKFYVCGFLFHEDYVLLVKKNRPDWQAGLLNGIGGKVEPEELSMGAMHREFQEETLGRVDPQVWEEFCVEQGRDYRVRFFRATSRERNRPLPPVGNDVGELMGWVEVKSLLADNGKSSLGVRPRIVGNLYWLLPMAQDWRRLCVTVDASIDDISSKAT